MSADSMRQKLEAAEHTADPYVVVETADLRHLLEVFDGVNALEGSGSMDQWRPLNAALDALGGG